MRRSTLYRQNENAKSTQKLIPEQEASSATNNVNWEIVVPSRIPTVSPVILPKNSKSRDSSPLKAVAFDIFDNEKPLGAQCNGKVKYAEMRKWKSSRKVVNHTLRRLTKVISFRLSDDEFTEQETPIQTMQTESDVYDNERTMFKQKLSRHWRSIAPNEFLKELESIRLDEDTTENLDISQRRMPLK